MKRCSGFALFSLYILAVFCLPVHAEQENEIKDVLVIHSYSASMNWVESMNKGLQKVIEKEHSQDIVYTFEFLDAKRYHSEEYFLHTALALKFKYSIKSFDAIVTCDDHAFNFVKDHGDLFINDIPVFYCGLNDIYLEIDEENAKGLFEENPLLNNFQLITTLLPEVRKILIVIDENTRTNKVYRKRISNEIIPVFNEVEIEFVENLSFSELEKELSSLEDNTAVFYFSYLVDRMGEFIPHMQAAKRLLRRCVAPVFTMNRIYLPLNVIGGYVTDPEAHAETIAIMLTDYLRGIDFDKLDISDYKLSNLFPLIINQDVLESYDISIKSIPESAIIRNDQDIKNAKVKREILHFILIIIFLILIVGYMFYIDIRNKSFRRKTKAEIDFWKSFNEGLPGMIFTTTGGNNFKCLSKGAYSDIPDSEIDEIKKLLPDSKTEILSDLLAKFNEQQNIINFYSKSLQINIYFMVLIIPEYLKGIVNKVTVILIDNTKNLLVNKELISEARNDKFLNMNIEVCTAISKLQDEEIFLEHINSAFESAFMISKNQIKDKPLYLLIPNKTHWSRNIKGSISSEQEINWNEFSELENVWYNIRVFPVNLNTAAIYITNLSAILEDEDLIKDKLMHYIKENKKLSNALRISEGEKVALNRINKERSKMAVLGEFFLAFYQLIEIKMDEIDKKQDFLKQQLTSSEFSIENIHNNITEVRNSYKKIKEQFKAVKIVNEQEDSAYFDLSELSQKFSETFKSIVEMNNIALEIEVCDGCKCRGSSLDMLQIFFLILNSRLSAYNRIENIDKHVKVIVKSENNSCMVRIESKVIAEDPELIDSQAYSAQKDSIRYKKEIIELMRDITESSFSGRLNVMEEADGHILQIEIPLCMI